MQYRLEIGMKQFEILRLFEGLGFTGQMCLVCSLRKLVNIF